MKEIKGSTKTNGKVSCVQSGKNFKLLKCQYYHKPSRDSRQSLSGFQWHFFYGSRKNNSKTCIEPQKTPNSKSQSNPKKE